MAVLTTFERDGYYPDYGMLVLRDVRLDGHWGVIDEESVLGELATDAHPGGTIALAGNGWVFASAGDGNHTIHLEHHDCAPPYGWDGWDDLVETPLRTMTGAVGLTHLTGTQMTVDLVLNGAGLYRARIARKRGADFGDTWLLQFWAAEFPEPPRWLVRGRPPVAGGDPGWSTVLGYQAQGLISAVVATAGTDGATVEQVARHQQAPGRLDQPLFPAPPEPLPTGHADLDSMAWSQRATALDDSANKLAELAGFAAQLRVPSPTTPRELLALLVAAGVLTVDSGRYRVVADPPRAQDVLELPAERVSWLERADATQRYTAFAADLVSTVAWMGPRTMTVAELADRVLASEKDVRQALEYAVSMRMLAVDDDTNLSLTALPKQVVPSYSTPPVRAPRRQAVVAPLGAPPRAGIVAGDEVIVWRDGEPMVLASLSGERAYRALKSAYGIVVVGFSGLLVLVRPDGGITSLGADIGPRPRLSEDGRYLAVVEDHSGRRSRHQLHVFDLADHSRQTMPWDESQDLDVFAILGGTVSFSGDHSAMVWTPGSPPEALGRSVQEVDPVSGRSLGIEDSDGVVVTDPDGTRTRLRLAQGVHLAPGGQSLYSYRHAPAAVTFFDIAAAEDPRVHWLPDQSNLSTVMPSRPTWETTETLLIPARHGALLLRLNVRTGESETVQLPEKGNNTPVLVQPMLV